MNLKPGWLKRQMESDRQHFSLWPLFFKRIYGKDIESQKYDPLFHLNENNEYDDNYLDEMYIPKNRDWFFPVKANGIPINLHPGAFGIQRRNKYFHTGIDLYCKKTDLEVYAVEDGVVHSTGQFTGKNIKTPQWNDTEYIMIKGKSGIVCYGEIETDLNIGDTVQKGQKIAEIIPVLKKGQEKPDVPGHSRYMLHLELYTEAEEPIDWRIGCPKPSNLLDPTPCLLDKKLQILT